ncbi:MAG: nitrate ABC transporter ATP-binding protein, partial [Comamonadaceae bacterium]|nr:nitrate ABC transporter ATP-binding protein [Comamonadaceae bacterium]
LMDEAFSALDVLTGERLREDILELWTSGKMPTQAMLVVSHNIEEAVLMADRVLIFGTDPGRIRFQLAVQIPRPRDPESADVRALVDEVYALMTAGSGRAGRGAGAAAAPLGQRLPRADVARMDGLLEYLVEPPFDGRADLPKLAEATELADNELLAAAQALSLLGLAQLESGDLQITPLGRRYVEGAHMLRQEIFGQQVLAHVPLAAHIRHSLEQEPSGQLPEEPFLRLLSEHQAEAEAERTLQTVVAWGRHGEVFEYDYNAGTVRLPTGEDEVEAPGGGQA